MGRRAVGHVVAHALALGGITLDAIKTLFTVKLYMRLWYPLRYEMPDRLRRGIANHVPDWLVYHATIRAFSAAWAKAGDKHPDDLTFSEVVKPWGNTWERESA